jgi:hypothetical protein
MRDINTFWFKHYANNWSSMSVESMMSVYGAEGYGFYYIILESLCVAEGNTINIEGKGILPAIAKRMQTDVETAKTFISDCSEEFGLLTITDGYIESQYIKESLDAANKRKETAKKGADARWNKKTTEEVVKVEDNGFDEFWELYDKKVGRAKACSLWLKLSKAKKKDCMDYIPKYKKSQPDVQYRKHPETFLRNESWNDEIYKPGTQTTQDIKNASAEDVTKAFM